MGKAFFAFPAAKGRCPLDPHGFGSAMDVDVPHGIVNGRVVAWLEAPKNSMEILQAKLPLVVVALQTPMKPSGIFST